MESLTEQVAFGQTPDFGWESSNRQAREQQMQILGGGNVPASLSRSKEVCEDSERKSAGDEVW